MVTDGVTESDLENRRISANNENEPKESKEEKRLGKIKNVYFGILDNNLGLHMQFSGKNWGVNWSESYFDPTLVQIDDFTKWSENDRNSKFLKIMNLISETLNKAGVRSIGELKNIPVECTFKNDILQKWRILTEVL